MNSPSSRNAHFESLAKEAKLSTSKQFSNSKIKQFTKEILISANNNKKPFQLKQSANNNPSSLFIRSRSPNLELKLKSKFLNPITRSKLSNIYNQIYETKTNHSFFNNNILTFSSSKPSFQKTPKKDIRNISSLQINHKGNIKIMNTKKELVNLLKTTRINGDGIKWQLNTASPLTDSYKKNISMRLKDDIEVNKIKKMRKGIDGILNKESRPFVNKIMLNLGNVRRIGVNRLNKRKECDGMRKMKRKENKKDVELENDDGFYSMKKIRRKMITGKGKEEQEDNKCVNITEMLKSRMKLYGLV